MKLKNNTRRFCVGVLKNSTVISILKICFLDQIDNFVNLVIVSKHMQQIDFKALIIIFVITI